MQVKLPLLISAAAGAAASWLLIILYDAVVIGSDILTDPMQHMLHWQSPGEVTALLHLLSPLLTVFLLFVSWRKAGNVAIGRPLFAAGMCCVLFFLLSAYMALEVHFDLYHGDITGKEALFRSVAEQWIIFQSLRAALLVCVLILTVKAAVRSGSRERISGRS